MNKYKVGKALGSGSFGTTYLATDNKTGENVAIKEIRCKTDSEIQLAVNEAGTLKGLNRKGHTFWPKYIGYDLNVRVNSAKVFIVTEYIDGTLLMDLIDKLDIQQKWVLTRELIRGLVEIHAAGFAHLDIKDDNVMVLEDELKIKYIDFGLSCTTFSKNSKLIPCLDAVQGGTLAYMPREAFVIRGRTFKIVAPSDFVEAKARDVWALGVTLYKLFYEEYPFNVDGDLEIVDEIYNNKFKPWRRDGKNKYVNKLLKYMLNNDKRARPTIQEVHDFFMTEVIVHI